MQNITKRNLETATSSEVDYSGERFSNFVNNFIQNIDPKLEEVQCEDLDIDSFDLLTILDSTIEDELHNYRLALLNHVSSSDDSDSDKVFVVEFVGTLQHKDAKRIRFKYYPKKLIQKRKGKDSLAYAIMMSHDNLTGAK